MASYKQELEKRGPEGIPSLDDIEPGKICGAVIPMSERAQTQMRDSIEVIDYLLNQERVVWSLTPHFSSYHRRLPLTPLPSS